MICTKKSIHLNGSNFHYNNLKFAENKQFNLEFWDEDLLQGIIFLKNRDYFLMSMSCFIEVENDITELKQYPPIKKRSELADRFIKNLQIDILVKLMFCVQYMKKSTFLNIK